MKRGWKRRKQKRRNQNKSLFLNIILFFVFFLLTWLSFYEVDHKLIPAIEEISHARTTVIANQLIDNAVEKTLQATPLSQSDFLIANSNQLDAYQANTSLITSFCVALSKEINENVNSLENEMISIPIGAVTNLHYFANKGPRMNFSLMPAGSALVDYETAFTSTGINQINYKIWVNLAIEIKIVNPLYSENIQLQRKVMIADVVFGGKVPSHYFNMGASGDYLLTE